MLTLADMVLTLDHVLTPVMLLNCNYWYMYITFIVMITKMLLLVSCICTNISYQLPPPPNLIVYLVVDHLLPDARENR